MKRLIKFNNNIRSFSAEEVPDEPEDNAPPEGIPEQPDEPTDYLNGIPATVLDLKDPIFETDPDEYARRSDSRLNGFPDDDLRDSFIGVANNLNKESAINRRLNELGSTDYDLDNDSNRFMDRQSITSDLDESYSRANNFDKRVDNEMKDSWGITRWLTKKLGGLAKLDREDIAIGLKDPLKWKAGLYGSRVIDKDSQSDFTVQNNSADVISHEFGHLNDPDMGWRKKDPYFHEYTDSELREAYGDKFTDAYNNFNGEFAINNPFHTLHHDHTPFEVYADAASMRSALFKSGVWNGKDPITEDMIVDYLDSEREFRDAMGETNDHYPDDPNINYGTPSQRLDNYFDIPNIAKLLNSSRRYSIK